MDDLLRKLQRTELKILDEFVRVCEKNGLRYYLIGGTLLGAIRHGGFIPWDDDIDVWMPREDYDRLAEIWESEASPRFFFQCPETDPNYYLTYTKIRLNGTEIYEERFRNASFRKGIFIDVFPLDPCPKPGLISHLLFNILAVMNYRGQVDSGEEYRPYEELSGKIGFALLRLYSKRGLLRLRRKVLRLAKRLGRGDHVASYSGAYGYRREVYPVELLGKGAAVHFEEKEYRAPEQWAEVLRRLYGDDYMQLPPPSEQKKHIDVERTVIFECEVEST